jgi:hypothetical protein
LPLAQGREPSLGREMVEAEESELGLGEYTRTTVWEAAPEARKVPLEPGKGWAPNGRVIGQQTSWRGILSSPVGEHREYPRLARNVSKMEMPDAYSRSIPGVVGRRDVGKGEGEGKA